MQNHQQNTIEELPPSSFQEEMIILGLDNPSPDDPHWSWWSALLVWFASVVLLVAVPSLVVIPYVLSKGINVQDAEGLKNFLLNDYGAVLLQIGLVLPIHIITFAISWAVVTKFKRFSFRESLGWEWGGFKIWHIAAIIVGFFLMAWGMTSIFGEQENDITRILKSSRSAVYIVAFLATFTAPIVEEVVYRGILYSAFKKRFGIVVAVIAATFLFALVHYFQYWGDITALTMVTLLSFILTMVRVKTGNLLPCIILHFVFNGIQSLLLLMEPYLREQAAQQGSAFIHFIK